MAVRARIGDVVTIGTFGDFTVIGHYVHADTRRGPFVQLYKCGSNWKIEDGLISCEKLYSPILVGIGAAVSSGRWKVVGRILPDPFQFGKYLMYGMKDNWFLFDGVKERRLGSIVPDEYKELETLSVWSADLLEERIRTGINPISYHARQSWSW